MTTDEVLDKHKDALKEFFENKENQILLADNNFEKLYKKWDYIPTILTTLLLKSNISFLNYMEQIPSYCFFGIDIKSIVIPNSITSIGEGVFSECSGLTSVIIPTSVTNINDYTFNGCSELTNIQIPNSVTRIGIFAFLGCNKLTKINYLGTKNQWLQVIKGPQGSSSIKTIHCIDGDIEL